MLKKLLTVAAVSALGLSASALDLSLEDLNAGWDATYDPETKTITYDNPWSGKGWGYWDELADFSEYTHVIVEMEPTEISAQLVVEYDNGDEDPIIEVTGFSEVGISTLKIKLNAEHKSEVKQIYLQCGATPGTITLVSAQVVDKSAEGGAEELWSGSYTATGWNAGATIIASQVKAGDILHYYMTPGESETAQVIIKGADWSNLPGTAKIVNSSIIDGVVEVIVNEQMLDNCGGSIFLQGDGGITCTKVEIAGDMEMDEDEYVVNFGERIFPVELYTTLPETAKYLCVATEGMPEWLQVCNSSWEAMVEIDAAQVLEDGDGNYLISFPLTDEIIRAINADKAMVLNGDVTITYFGCVATEEAPENDVVVVGSEDNNTPWWSAWSQSVNLYGDGAIHFEFINYTDEVNNWDNWLIVFTNSGLSPNDEGYASDQEWVVLRADNYGWGPLYGSTVLQCDYDWDTFKQDMNGAEVSITAERQGNLLNMTALASCLNGKEYAYTAAIEGIQGDLLGAFLTVEMGHLVIEDMYASPTSSISSAIEDSNAPVRVYGLSGIEMTGKDLAPGIYIMKQGSKAQKVLVK